MAESVELTLERRPAVLGAEGIEVEGVSRRGECGGGQQRERRGETIEAWR